MFFKHNFNILLIDFVLSEETLLINNFSLYVNEVMWFELFVKMLWKTHELFSILKEKTSQLD